MNIKQQLTLDSKINELGVSNSTIIVFNAMGYKTIGDVCRQHRIKLYNDINNDVHFNDMLAHIHASGFMLDSEVKIYEEVKQKLEEGQKINFGHFKLPNKYILLLEKCFGNLDNLCLLTENSIMAVLKESHISKILKDECFVLELIYLVKHVGLTFATTQQPKANKTWDLEAFVPLISKTTCNVLKNANIYTLEDLLKKSQAELSEIKQVGKITLKEITLFVHRIGYTLAGELEKRQQLLEKRSETLLSLETPIEFYSFAFSQMVYNVLCRIGVKTLKDLITTNPDDLLKYRLGQKSIQDIETFVNSFGYSLGEQIDDKPKELLKSELDISLLELLEKLNQPLSVKAFNGLRRMGIDTLNDLLSLSLSDLKRDRRIAESAKQEVIDFVHSLGYDFADEKNIEQKIQIQVQANEEISNRIASKEQTLNSYNALIEEKKQLLQREQELDKELTKALQTITELLKLNTIQQTR